MSAGFSFIASPLNAKSDEKDDEINNNGNSNNNEITPTSATSTASTGFSAAGTGSQSRYAKAPPTQGKTQHCRNYKFGKGSCAFGDSCAFLHEDRR